MALVVYNASIPATDGKLLSVRHFSFGSHLLKIKQVTKNDGKGGTNIGFGAGVYDAAFVLCDYLYRNAEILEGKSVVEIGSGPGLVGVLSSLLCSYCICTDGDDISVDLTRENIISNERSNNCIAQRLLWNVDTDIQDVFEILQAKMNTKAIDVIVASDIIALPYEEAFSDLLETLVKLATKSTVIVISYHQRHAEIESRCFSLLRQYFSIEMLERSASVHEDFLTLPISVMILRLI